MNIPLSPLAFAQRARRLYPAREAVVDGDRRWTYAQFLDRCDRWSATLQRWGVTAGDRIAYIAPNTPAQLESFYAVPALGAIVVPINYRLTAADFAYIINHSGARIVCAHRDYLDAVDGIRASIPGVERFVALEHDPEGARPGWIDYESTLSSATPDFTAAAIDEDDVITINYTSGTTAQPKGVMITHRNAYMNVLGILAHTPFGPGDRYLWTLPMFHANGWTFTWLVTAKGAAHICLPKFDVATVFALMDRERVTFFCAAPTVLIALANAPEALTARARRDIRVFTAGAPPAAATIERIERDFGWHLTQLYGLTETSPMISICEERPEHGALAAHERAAVKARQGVELVSSGELGVAGADDQEVPHDGEAMGEIRVRGNVVMKGYYNDPEATARAIRGGWFYTGDMAVVHPDGYIEIRDRSKDVIISGGENISSVEVEGALLHHPAIHEAAIVGVPHPKWGEAPHAFVVLKPGQTATEADVRAFARERLAHFKAPQGVTFVSELPKTATGKIQKYVLRGGKRAISTQ